MSFAIPSSRVFQWQDLGGGAAASVLPATDTVLVGGAARVEPVAAGAQNLYLVTATSGTPALTRNGRQKTYQSGAPGTAATKAFYAWWRATERGPLTRAGAKDWANDIWSPLQSNLDAMRAKLAPEKRVRFDLQRTAYEDAFRRIDRARLNDTLVVNLLPLGGKGNPRSYRVKYEPNTRPNLMEVMGPSGGSMTKVYTPIVVNAVATHMPAGTAIQGGAQTFFLESEIRNMQ